MDFALLNAVRNLPDAAYPLQEVYADYISDAVLAEELGFTRYVFLYGRTGGRDYIFHHADLVHADM